MEDSTKTKGIITILVLSIILIAMFIIASIIYIWTPKKEKIVDKLPLGKYETKYISDSKIVEKYINQISYLLENNAYKELYKLLNKSYIENFDMNEQKFKTSLVNKGISGKTLEIQSFQKQTIAGKRYYKVKVETRDLKTSATFIFIEEAPNIYTLSFDDYLYTRRLNKEYIIDGFKMIVLSEDVRTNKIKLGIRLENLTNNDITINANSSSEPIVAIISGKEQSIRSSLAGGIPFVLGKNRYQNVILNIGVDDFKHSRLNGILIKGVDKGNGTKITSIKFPYYLEQ